MIEWTAVRVLSFDCYGTLIDWEEGILAALAPLLKAHGVTAGNEELLEQYAVLESKAEQGPFRNYKSVLRSVMEGFAEKYGFHSSEEERDCLTRSLPRWMPFPDTIQALDALGKRFKLVLITNVDGDLLSFTRQRLGGQFYRVITSERMRSYKPSLNNFNGALGLMGVPKRQIVHVAQSLYHDIVPANRLGISSVWVNRRQGKQGSGATSPAQAVPDLTVPDLRSLVELIGREDGRTNKMV